jgi:hypothetical protein
MAGRKITPKRETEPAKAKPQPAQAEAPAPAPEKPPTIRSVCEAGLLAGLAYDQIIANVKAVHPAAVTTKGCIAWYRSKIVKKGLVPSGKEMAAARKRAAEAEAKTAKAGEE